MFEAKDLVQYSGRSWWERDAKAQRGGKQLIPRDCQWEIGILPHLSPLLQMSTGPSTYMLFVLFKHLGFGNNRVT